MVTETLKVSTGQGTDFNLPIAGLGVRSYAFLIDWHIRFIIAIAWLFSWILFFDIGKSLWNNFSTIFEESSSLFLYVVFLPAAIVYFLYHPILEIIMQGRTPGKRMAKIRIVTENGHTPAMGAHIIRNIFRMIDSLPSLYCFGIVLALFNKRQLRLGDIAANTVLVYENDIEEAAMMDVDHFINEGAFSLEQLQTIRDLIDRWPNLDSSLRIKMARQLLHKVHTQETSIITIPDENLLPELKKLIEL